MKPSVEYAVARQWSSSEPLAQPVDVAERGRLEDVELRVDRQQRVGRRPVEAVARQHDRRHAIAVARGREGGIRRDELDDPRGVIVVDRIDEVLDRAGHGTALPLDEVRCCN